MGSVKRGVLTALLPLSVFSVGPAAAVEPLFHTRSYNAFTQVFGRPEFFAGSLLAQGSTEVRGVVDLVSFAEVENRSNAQFELDGETYHVDLNLDHTLTQRWEIGVRIPFLRHSGGFMDAAVENYHDLIGAPNGSRDAQPRNELRFFLAQDGQTTFLLDDSTQGIGDIQLRSRYLLTGPGGGGRYVALHAGLKLPTGDADNLRGSGAADYSFGLGFSDPVTFEGARLTVSGHAGVLILGDGDVLSELQEDAVGFAGLQLTFAATPRLALIAQIQGAGPYFDTNVDALGSTTVQLGFGANVHFPRSGWDWRFGIVEDGLSKVMPDFALHMEVSRVFRPRE